jgi:RNA recognition motif-containing protein
MNIYVGNISRDTNEEDLKIAFTAYGEVSKVTIIKDKFTGESRGFGFIEMQNKTQALAAISGLNGSELKGRPLTVNEARPKNNNRGDGNGRRNNRYGFGNNRRFGGGRNSW